MTSIKTKDYTGYSDNSLDEAIQNALEKTDEYKRIEVVEARSSHTNTEQRTYQIILTAFSD